MRRTKKATPAPAIEYYVVDLTWASQQSWQVTTEFVCVKILAVVCAQGPYHP